MGPVDRGVVDRDLRIRSSCRAAVLYESRCGYGTTNVDRELAQQHHDKYRLGRQRPDLTALLQLASRSLARSVPKSASERRQDSPYFVIHEMSQGMSGLMVAALLSAAMSSLSIGINSITTVLTAGFFDHNAPAATSVTVATADRRRAQTTALVIGLLALGIG